MTRAVIPAGSHGMPPIHPGEILKDEFMEPFGLSANKLAALIHVTPARVAEIVNGKRGITTDSAIRFGKVFDTSPQLWLNLQQMYELRLHELNETEDLQTIVPLAEAVSASLAA